MENTSSGDKKETPIQEAQSPVIKNEEIPKPIDTTDMKQMKHLKRPLNLIVIGMAGSGKSTFLGKLHTHLLEYYDTIPYMVNLDPAVSFLPFSPKNDIRDEIKYKEVMSKYGLGPNGAIMTSLNLYAANFHLTLDKMEESQADHKYFCPD